MESSNAVSGYISKGIEIRISERYLYPEIYYTMFIVAVVTMAKIHKQSECLTDESRKCAICYMSTGVLFSVKKKMLLFMSTWVAPDDFMLCEMSQSQKNTACVHLYRI